MMMIRKLGEIEIASQLPGYDKAETEGERVKDNQQRKETEGLEESLQEKIESCIAQHVQQCESMNQDRPQQYLLGKNEHVSGYDDD
jgi:hypothetical protein